MSASAPSITVSTPSTATKTSTDSRVPTPEQAAANRQAAYDKVKSAGSSMADYVSNFETPAERRSREAAQARMNALRSSGGARAKGGAIKTKKMAKGGMTSTASSASKRADGIASKGKTKCRMY
jgi:hypothetical protein